MKFHYAITALLSIAAASAETDGSIPQGNIVECTMQRILGLDAQRSPISRCVCVKSNGMSIALLNNTLADDDWICNDTLQTTITISESDISGGYFDPSMDLNTAHYQQKSVR